jgi:hypothetical protein
VCHFEHLLNRVLFYNFGLAFRQKSSADGLLPRSEEEANRQLKFQVVLARRQIAGHCKTLNNLAKPSFLYGVPAGSDLVRRLPKN